jgi:hypothetical protein
MDSTTNFAGFSIVFIGDMDVMIMLPNIPAWINRDRCIVSAFGIDRELQQD